MPRQFRISPKHLRIRGEYADASLLPLSKDEAFSYEFDELIAAAVTVAEPVIATETAEAVAVAATQDNDNNKYDPNAAIVVTEKHISFPPLIGFTPFYVKT